MSKSLVLLVEDDVDYASGLRKQLELRDIRVVAADSLKKAFVMFRTRPAFDGIMSDINLPYDGKQNQGGFEFAKKVRRENADIPIFGYSSIFSPDELKGSDEKESGPFTRFRSRDDLDDQDSLESVLDSFISMIASYASHRNSEWTAASAPLGNDTLPIFEHHADDIGDFLSDGLSFVELNNSDFISMYPDDRDKSNIIKRPIPLWIVQRGPDQFSCEVYRSSNINSFGGSVDDVVKKIVRKIYQIHKEIDPNSSPQHSPVGVRKSDIDYLKNYLICLDDEENS